MLNDLVHMLKCHPEQRSRLRRLQQNTETKENVQILANRKTLFKYVNGYISNDVRAYDHQNERLKPLWKQFGVVPFTFNYITDFTA